MAALAWAVLAICSGQAAAFDLPEALKAADARDPGVSSANAQRDAAAENVAIARSRLRPQVTLQSSVQHVDQTTIRDAASSTFSGPSSNHQLSTRQTLYRPRDWIGVDVGDRQARQGEARRDAVRSQLWAQVITAWLDALAAQAVLDSNLRAEQALAEAAQQELRRWKEGAGTRDTLVEAQAQYEQTKAQTAIGRLMLQTQTRLLETLTGLPAADLAASRLPEFETAALPFRGEEDVLRLALVRSPQLVAAALAADVDLLRLGQASADHRPVVDLVASVSRARSDTINTQGVSYHTAQVGLQLSFPVYSGGGLSAAERQAASTYAASSSERDAAEQRLRLQVNSDWNNCEASLASLSAAQALVAAARTQRRAAELGVVAGTRTRAELGNAELILTRREYELFSLRASVGKAITRLIGQLPVDDAVWAQWTQQLVAWARP